LSKLFDQLKDAARSRGEKSPGILVDALRRQQDGASADVEPVAPAPDNGARGQAPSGAQSPKSPVSLSGIGLAVVIFLVAVLAWRSTPFTPPRKHKIDPTELKLDRSFDPQRVSPKGTSPAGTPS
jgi:hypothetical protein